ncbi:ABC transporter substrate-binding protein [Allobranchiibius sp. GilTou73]|uniref:ABC transporter substrate-binding protein n=1 Tax=Allobranchiibius sp. GilTou73 TaxID=2904523 RepID=UPI001F36EB9B|nr:ABC transporter substrate-binding protein [Allobranchiibius sp. GilTou73]UIJ34419.1 ABC transporter substrate-binding protein [Allobranchiibius sp. GilTou73]
MSARSLIRPLPTTGAVVALAAAAGMSLTACGSSAAAGAPKGAPSGTASTLKLGYFANVTHAVPVVGVGDGSYAKALGSTKLSTTIYNAGPTAVQALLSGAIDAAYVGPNPAINAFIKSHGTAVRLIAGGASGGAALVVKPSITDVSQLAGKTVADPQRGGTQDIALKYYLKNHGLGFTGSGGKNVNVVSQDNAQTLTLFKQGRIDAAWLPEPWVSRLQQQAGAKVLVDEKSQWPGGNFVTTNLLVSTSYLKKNPRTVSALLGAQVATAQSITADPTMAATELDADLGKLTGKKLPEAVVVAALKNVKVGWDPYASSLKELASHAAAVDLLSKDADLQGIYDLGPLNAVLQNKKLAVVSDGGLGAKGSS